MKKKTIVLATCLILGIASIAGTAMAGMGPAPNSGDGDPDGSGFNAPLGPKGECTEPNGEYSGHHYCGQNPNKGDCTQDCLCQ